MTSDQGFPKCPQCEWLGLTDEHVKAHQAEAHSAAPSSKDVVQRAILEVAVAALRKPNGSLGGDYTHCHVLTSAEAAALLSAVETTTHHCRRCRMLIPWTAGDDPPFCAYCGVSSPVEPTRELTLLDFGYAPGNYTFKCHDCGQEAVGDKRALRCETCAAQALRENRSGAVKASANRDFKCPICDRIDPHTHGRYA